MHIDDDQFDEMLRSAETVVVGFGAPWCGNCRRFLPLLENATDLLGTPLYKITVDDNESLISRYDIHSVPFRYDVRGVPTVIVFHRGAEKGRIAGALGSGELIRKLEELIHG